jgi:hypothetical protein
MRRGVAFALALAAAMPALAQGEAGQGDRREQELRQAERAAEPAQGTSDAFQRACVDLLAGRTPRGEKAIEALKGACADYMSALADERIRVEQQRQARALVDERQQQARVEAGQGSGQPGEGEGVLAAFERAAGELTGPERGQMMGYRRGGAIRNLLVTNPIGWFSGLGVNAELHRSFEPKFSWVAGARYSTTDASNGTASTFGAMGGVDWYIVGRNNEGLRIGPRMELAAGREEFQGDSTFARLALAGEVGYNFIASNGLSALLAAGVGGRIAGDEQNEDFASFAGGEFGPFLKLGLGYAW